MSKKPELRLRFFYAAPRLSRFFCSQKTMSGMWFWISLFPFYSPVLPLFCSPSLLFPSPFSSVLQLSLSAFFFIFPFSIPSFSLFLLLSFRFSFLSFFLSLLFPSPFSSVLQLSLFPFFYSLFLFPFFRFFSLLSFRFSFLSLLFPFSLFLPSFNFPSHEPAAVWEASQAVSETSSGFCQVNE